MILPPPADLEAFGRGEPVKVRVRMVEVDESGKETGDGR
jgi:hypothetical protein